MFSRRIGIAATIVVLSSVLAACGASPIDQVVAQLRPPSGEPPAYTFASVETSPGFWSARVLVQDPQLTESAARQVAAAVARQQLAGGELVALRFTVLGMREQAGLQIAAKVYRVTIAMTREGAAMMPWLQASQFPAVEFLPD